MVHMQAFPCIGAALELDNKVDSAVSNVQHTLHIMYIFDVDNLTHAANLKWFWDNITSVHVLCNNQHCACSSNASFAMQVMDTFVACICRHCDVAQLAAHAIAAGKRGARCKEGRGNLFRYGF